MSVLPSGEQWTIRHGEHEAVVVEVGGGLRTYAFRGQGVLHGYPPDARCPGGRGQLLMPWPNRIRDGAYTFAGQGHQLALSEPERLNAIHGLTRWALWSVLDQAGDSLTLGYRLRPQQGWEWSLDLSVTYALTDSGLVVTPQARNVGMHAAPFGFGAHPYLSVGEDRVDEVQVAIPAAARLEVDERLLPLGLGLGLGSVAGTDLDFREPRVLGSQALDTAFTAIVSGADRCWRVSLAHPVTGRAVTLWADATAYQWLQIFTGDSLPRASRRVSGIAVEPMTCPPDAFNSGDALIVLEPGQEFSAPWGITPG